MVDVYLLVGAGVALGQLAPGPNLLAVAQTALVAGRRASVAVAAGVALVVFFWVSAATLGLAALLAALPALKTAVTVLGGAYLVYFGARALWRAVRGRAPDIAASIAVRSGFVKGALVNLTNVKSAMMWTAVASTLFTAGADTAGALLFAPIGAASAFAIYSMYAVVFSSAPARRLYGRVWRGFEAAFGALFALVGARLIASA